MSPEVTVVTFVPIVGLAILIATTAGSGPWNPERIAGLTLIFIGVAVLTIARFNLGNSFSVTPQAKKLVTHGVYSRIQHPVYVFSALVVAGLPLYFEQPAFLLALIPLVAMQVARARKEGRVLEEKFGDEYRDWKRTTWF